MEMTFDQALRPGALMHFAARSSSGYMMRSEKREGGYGSPNRRPPRRRKAGPFYIVITLLLSLLLWPVGMVLLWQRRLRMQAGGKLLISLLTLCMSVFLIVFTLTVPLDNVKFTAFQDRANDWLDKAAADMARAGDAAIRKTSETWTAMSDFAEASTQYACVHAADALEEGVRLAGGARTAIEGLFNKNAAPKATEAPALKPTAEGTEAPALTSEAPTASARPRATQKPKATRTAAAEVTEAPEPEPTEAGAALLQPATEEPAGTPTEAPVVETTEAPTEAPVENLAGAPLVAASEEPTEAPAGEPSEEPTEAPAGEPSEEPTEAPAGEPSEEPTEAPAGEPSEEPTEAPAEESTEEPTEEPTEQPTEEPTEAPAAAYAVKSAGLATVYFFDNGSKGFHNGPNRHEMNGAPAHTLQEAFDMGKNPCQSCGMPDQSILSEEHVAWVDADTRLHTTDECENFKGQWRLMSLRAALDAGCEACEACGATLYAEAVYPAPTATPEPEAVRPSTALKSAGEATVYYFNASKGYHSGPNCVGMDDAPAHTLAEAVAAGKRACSHCKPPQAALMDQPALWQDGAGICHTSDECPSFTGRYTLVPREEALAKGLAACPDCGAAEYLVPGTVLAGE